MTFKCYSGEWVKAVSKKKKKPTENASGSGNGLIYSITLMDQLNHIGCWWFSASPATSPTHKAGKKADKKKNEPVKKEDEKKNNEVIIEKESTQSAVEPTVVEVKPVVVEKPPAKPEIVEAKISVKPATKEEKPAIEKPAKAQAGKKEKNNNNADNAKPQKPAKVEAKPVVEKITETIAPVNGDDSEGISFTRDYCPLVYSKLVLQTICILCRYVAREQGHKEEEEGSS